MSNDLKDILANSNKDIDNQQLMDYLSNRLSGTERMEVEKTMADDEFTNDAIEGLQGMGSKKNIPAYIDQLNADLQKQLAKSRSRKEKRRIKSDTNLLLTIIIILILVIISFFILKKYLDVKHQQPANIQVTFRDHLSRQKFS